MASDADWVEDVRRWCSGAAGTPAPASASTSIVVAAADAALSAEALGYEAAHPALQARYWPDAPAD